ncbi:MAG TPA: hypothetical protein VGM49_07110 [Candidatus Limnocylindrales bacterium]|jgi:hypothetical protein
MTEPATTQWQLRDYRIEPGRFDVFLAAWRAGVLPLRRRMGFQIQAWPIPEESRFVWVIGYSGPGSFAEADRAYYASDARKAVSPEPGQWVIERQHFMVNPVVTEE